MIKDLEKRYDSEKYEKDIYEKWESSGYFDPDKMVEDGLIDKSAESHTIVLPPPNITAKLHLGHAVMIAVGGTLTRYRRMKGYKALWIPGTDHAAIATQNVVEKKLLEKGVSRQDLGREKFLEEVDVFLKKTQATILKQIRALGGCLDWSREAFTLDDQRQKAVKKMFIDMYKEGVIYRGERVVNWCPRCHSTLADDEVEYKTQQDVSLYTFRYSKDFPIPISTTRPETKLGDTAVAVNPKDDRYKQYIGKTFEVDFLGVALNIKVIADSAVDMGFGTGALGVTPAHSMADYQMSLSNGLEMVSVIDENAEIKEGFGEFSGLSAVEARNKIAEKLKEKALIEKEEKIENNLSICYRCGRGIEPLPSKQWFVNVDKRLDRLDGQSIKEKAINAAKSGEIRFVPERFKNVFLNWMENLHDWCISRQIWFGHRIPAWYRSDNDSGDIEIYVGDEEPEGDGWERDNDTLDTWFSSGMWTFSTLGWPDNFKGSVKSGDLSAYHPTQVLETGFEIITLWVSRMIMMSYYALEEKPFSDVYLHGMVMDDKGKKMSKSKGNGIDPMDMVERFGADPIRLSLMMGSTPGNNMKLSEEKIGQYRNFVNKLWNISRYILQTVDEIDDRDVDLNKLSQADKWILSRLNRLVKNVSRDIEAYDLSFAGDKLKAFTWDELADWYVEATKFSRSSEKGAVLMHILRTLLKLWHPFIPFATEAIWSEFNDSMLMVQKWPEPASDHQSAKDAESEFDLVINIIKTVRNARSENKVEPAKKVKALIYAGDKVESIERNREFIKNLRTGIEEIEIKESGDRIDKAIFATVSGMDIYLLGAVDPEKERKRIEKEIASLQQAVDNSNKKLENSDFVSRAPESVVNKEKERLQDAKDNIKRLKDRLNNI